MGAGGSGAIVTWDPVRGGTLDRSWTGGGADLLPCDRLARPPGACHDGRRVTAVACQSGGWPASPSRVWWRDNLPSARDAGCLGLGGVLGWAVEVGAAARGRPPEPADGVGFLECPSG